MDFNSAISFFKTPTLNMIYLDIDFKRCSVLETYIPDLRLYIYIISIAYV